MKISIRLFFCGFVLVQLSYAQVTELPEVTTLSPVTTPSPVTELPQVKDMEKCSKKHLCDCGPSGYAHLEKCFELFTNEYKQKMGDAWNECGITKNNITYADLSSYKEQLCPIPFEDKVECYAKTTLSLQNYMTELAKANKTEEFEQNNQKQSCYEPLLTFCTSNPGECKP